MYYIYIVILQALFLTLIFLLGMRFTRPKEPNAIKYDRRDRMRFGVLASFSTVIVAGCIIFMMVSDFDGLPVEISGGTVIGLMFSSGAVIVTWTVFLISFFYIRRLKKYGYDIPIDKRKFGSRLEYLGKSESYCLNCTGYSKESLILAGISFVIFLRAVGETIVIYFRYKPFVELAYLGICGFAPLVVFWMVRSVLFWRQRLRQSYRDDVEIDPGRKPRKHLAEGLTATVIYRLVMWAWIEAGYACLDCIYKIREAAGLYL